MNLHGLARAAGMGKFCGVEINAVMASLLARSRISPILWPVRLHDARCFAKSNPKNLAKFLYPVKTG